MQIITLVIRFLLSHVICDILLLLICLELWVLLLWSHCLPQIRILSRWDAKLLELLRNIMILRLFVYSLSLWCLSDPEICLLLAVLLLFMSMCIRSSMLCLSVVLLLALGNVELVWSCIIRLTLTVLVVRHLDFSLRFTIKLYQ